MAGDKVIDQCVFRTVQPNYMRRADPCDGVADPVTGYRNGVHVGETAAVSIQDS